MKVFLVDGTYELFRSYYGAPPARNRVGDEVGAARGLLRSLTALLSGAEATHVACAFDHVIESFRNDLFPGYKTGEGIDPALFAQFPVAERVTGALGITTWPMVEFEADDALATGAALAARDERVGQVLLCSPDKDLAQCVTSDRVVLLDRMRERVLDEAGVLGKFGVPPASIPDYLALVGDTADGIPGVVAWGPKSAAELLRAYGTIDAIPEDVARWTVSVRGAARLAASLNANREAARLYKVLATLRADVPLGVTVDDLEWRGPDRAKLEALAAELDDSGGAERALAVAARRLAAAPG